MGRARDLEVPVIATVNLLKSVGSARYIANTEPAAGLSEDLIRRIRKASDREAECIRVAGETVAASQRGRPGSADHHPGLGAPPARHFRLCRILIPDELAGSGAREILREEQGTHARAKKISIQQ